MILKTLKTIIKITYFPMLAWMIYAFFNPNTVSNEVVIGFIIYSFVILPWFAGNSAESYDWEDERDSFIHRLHNDPIFMDEVENIHYTPNND